MSVKDETAEGKEIIIIQQANPQTFTFPNMILLLYTDRRLIPITRIRRYGIHHTTAWLGAALTAGFIGFGIGLQLALLGGVVGAGVAAGASGVGVGVGVGIGVGLRVNPVNRFNRGGSAALVESAALVASAVLVESVVLVALVVSVVLAVSVALVV